MMTPALLDYFFTQRTDCFARLDERRLGLLHSIYTGPEYAAVLPPRPAARPSGAALRRHPRYSIKCPAILTLAGQPCRWRSSSSRSTASRRRRRRRCPRVRAARCRCALGEDIESTVVAEVVRRVQTPAGHFHGFRVDAPDGAWRRCVRPARDRDDARRSGRRCRTVVGRPAAPARGLNTARRRPARRPEAARCGAMLAGSLQPVSGPS
ncbi:MAG: hypothetical protein MZW92_21010 [Comamonadaceae bacterium]|nr:hypothetical protein [Comamonadaceae bacterium]